MRKSRTMLAVFCVFLMLCCLPGCRKTSASESASVDGSATAESAGGTRDNTPQVLNPEAPGTSVIGNDLIEIDLSNTTEGYVGPDTPVPLPELKSLSSHRTAPNTPTT